MPFTTKSTDDYAREGVAFRFIIEANPITKKNSQRLAIIRRQGKDIPIAFPSDQSKGWTKFASQVIAAQSQEQGYIRAWDSPVWVQCLVMRASAYKSDLNNYLAAIADVLEATKILTDDHWIQSWDGSRMGISYTKPRVEILVRPFPTPEMFVELEPDTDASAKRRNATRLKNLSPETRLGYPLRPNKGRHAPVLTADRELASKLKLPPHRELERRPEQWPTSQFVELFDGTLEHGDATTAHLEKLVADLRGTGKGVSDPEDLAKYRDGVDTTR